MGVRILEAVRRAIATFWENHVHFIELHYLYIGFMIFLSSGLYYCQPGTSWNYIDALFTATTGVTNTGLNVIDMSALSTFQILIMLFNSFIASHVAVSYIVLVVRKHYFSKRFEDILLFNKARRMREESRRRQRQQRKHQQQSTSSVVIRPLDTHIGKRRSAAITLSASSAIIDPQQHRRSSLNSIASSPVRGVHDRNTPRRHRSASTWMTSHNEIRAFFQDLRQEQNKLMDQREQQININLNNDSSNTVLDDTTTTNNLDQLEKQMTRAVHPYDHKVNNSGSSSTVHDNKEQQGIAFAGNIEQQREMARRRLEQERRFEELMEKIRRDVPLTETLVDTSEDEDEDNDSFFEDIMRQPIDKSQLTRQQRYRIGGAEYMALDILSRLVPAYYLGFIIISSFCFRGYIACSDYAQQVLSTSNANAPVDPWLFSFFFGVSALNNLGLTLLDASVSPFQNAPFPLLVAITLILVGNTAYAILLRFIIWALYKITPRTKPMRREGLRYLLDHPRRCYTLLFPSTQTWWLLIIVVTITVVEVICFLALDFWLPVLQELPWGSRVLDGIFQSVATRNAGFTVLPLSHLNPGTQLVFIVAMYISVYPVAISMRNSNVYQERALGIYRGDDEESMVFTDNDLKGPAPFIKLRRHPTINSVMTQSRKIRQPDFFVLTQIQRQLTSDICWVIVGVFCICIIESATMMSSTAITMATVIYECVSAFANVGGSIGYPDTNTSQAAQYRTLSKLVVILLMYRGRHRGLPSAIDRAVLLPSEQLEQHELEDQMFKRRNTSFTSGRSPSLGNFVFYTRSSTL